MTGREALSKLEAAMVIVQEVDDAAPEAFQKYTGAALAALRFTIAKIKDSSGSPREEDS